MKRLLPVILLVSFYASFGQLQTSEVPGMINMQEYQALAAKEFERHYEETIRLVEEQTPVYEVGNDSAAAAMVETTFTSKPLSLYYKREELKLYSIPVFGMKQQPFQTECNGGFIDLISWDSLNLVQRVLIVSKDTLVAEFMTSARSYMVAPPQGLIHRTFAYDDLPRFAGGSFKNFFPANRIEKNYFSFEINGFIGRFVIRDDELYYVRKEYKGKYTGVNYQKVQRKGEVIWHKVNDDGFLSVIKKERAMSGSYPGNVARTLKRCLRP